MNVQTAVHAINSLARVTIIESNGFYCARYEHDKRNLVFSDTALSLDEALMRLEWRHLGEGIPNSHLSFIHKLRTNLA